MRLSSSKGSEDRMAKKGETDAQKDYVARVALPIHKYQPRGSMGGLDGPPSN
jgi:hypothetical protein